MKVLGLADDTANNFNNGVLYIFLEGSSEYLDYGDGDFCVDCAASSSSEGASDIIPICSNDELKLDKRDGTSEGACKCRKDRSPDIFTDEMSLGSANDILDHFLGCVDEGVLVHSNMALRHLSSMICSLP